MHQRFAAMESRVGLDSSRGAGALSIHAPTAYVALSLRERKAELAESCGSRGFGLPLAEREGYKGASGKWNVSATAALVIFP
jgi:hypothetical protein